MLFATVERAWTTQDVQMLAVGLGAAVLAVLIVTVGIVAVNLLWAKDEITKQQMDYEQAERREQRTAELELRELDLKHQMQAEARAAEMVDKAWQVLPTAEPVEGGPAHAYGCAGKKSNCGDRA